MVLKIPPVVLRQESPLNKHNSENYYFKTWHSFWNIGNHAFPYELDMYVLSDAHMYAQFHHAHTLLHFQSRQGSSPSFNNGKILNHEKRTTQKRKTKKCFVVLLSLLPELCLFSG